MRWTQLAHKCVSTDEKIMWTWISESNLVLQCLPQQDLSFIISLLRREFKNPATTIITTNSVSRVAGPVDPPLRKCQCTSRKISSYVRGTSMNYAYKKVESLTLPLKYPTICENVFQMTLVTCSDLIQGIPMQPKDHWTILLGYSSSSCATLSLYVKLKFCKVCLCCRLTNIQAYE